MKVNVTVSLVHLGALVLLAGCFGTGDKKAPAEATERVVAGEVLLTIAGKPALTAAEFEEYYDQLLEQQPQLKQFAALMPDLKQNVFSTVVSQKVLEHWAREQKVTEKASYKADRAMLIENVDRGLAIKYFQAEHPMDVSDADVKKFYETNKDTMYALSPAGVAASGVSFDKEDAAKAFLAKVQAPGANFEKVASESKLKVQNFGRVNETSQQVDATVREKILAAKKFPSVQLVKAGNTFFVVQAQSKEAAKYYSFDQAKEDARGRLTNERMADIFNKEVAKLKQTYGVVESADYFSKKQEQVPVEQAPAAKTA